MISMVPASLLDEILMGFVGLAMSSLLLCVMGGTAYERRMKKIIMWFPRLRLPEILTTTPALSFHRGQNTDDIAMHF